MFNDPMYVVALLLSVALLLHVLLFGRITKQGEARNKFLAAELEKLQEQFDSVRKSRDDWHKRVNEWVGRFEGLEELAAETGEKHKKQIAELEKQIAELEELGRIQTQQIAGRVDQVGQLKKQIVELEKAQESFLKATNLQSDMLKNANSKMRTAWAVHQSFRVYGKPSLINLSAIVFADGKIGAVLEFTDRMAKHMAGKKIRTRTPIKANRVFPD